MLAAWRPQHRCWPPDFATAQVTLAHFLTASILGMLYLIIEAAVLEQHKRRLPELLLSDHLRCFRVDFEPFCHSRRHKAGHRTRLLAQECHRLLCACSRATCVSTTRSRPPNPQCGPALVLRRHTETQLKLHTAAVGQNQPFLLVRRQLSQQSL